MMLMLHPDSPFAKTPLRPRFRSEKPIEQRNPPSAQKRKTNKQPQQQHHHQQQLQQHINPIFAASRLLKLLIKKRKKEKERKTKANCEKTNNQTTSGLYSPSPLPVFPPFYRIDLTVYSIYILSQHPVPSLLRARALTLRCKSSLCTLIRPINSHSIFILGFRKMQTVSKRIRKSSPSSIMSVATSSCSGARPTESNQTIRFVEIKGAVAGKHKIQWMTSGTGVGGNSPASPTPASVIFHTRYRDTTCSSGGLSLMRQCVWASLVRAACAGYTLESRRQASSASASSSSARVSDFSSTCPFKVLGIPRPSSNEVVREAYLHLCREHHPDVGGCETTFKRIGWAYDSCKLHCETSGYQGEEDDGDLAEEEEGARHEKTTADGEKGTHKSGGERRRKKHCTPEEEERRAEARREWKRAQQERDDAELREEFRSQFEKAADPELIDTLLEEALMSGCFSRQDVTEPLMMAIQRYHLGIDFGAAHAAKCFDAMDTWERLAERKVHPMFFHTLLTLYSNQGFAHTSDSMTVSETVNTIMDRMADKGLPHDDWTIMIANRVFRAVPYPDW